MSLIQTNRDLNRTKCGEKENLFFCLTPLELFSPTWVETDTISSFASQAFGLELELYHRLSGLYGPFHYFRYLLFLSNHFEESKCWMMLSYIFGKLMNVMGLAVAPNVSEKNGKEKNELSDLNIQLKHRYMI